MISLKLHLPILMSQKMSHVLFLICKRKLMFFICIVLHSFK
uniref:Uncharacterized protein n=1 Tax=Arundo donax TaxID=35708 RepID=A0A0A9GTH8_ARUDO